MNKKIHINKKSILFGVVLSLILIVPVKFYGDYNHGFNFSVSHIPSALLGVNSAFAKDKKTEKNKKAAPGTDQKTGKDTGEKGKKNGKETQTKPCPDCPKCPDLSKVVFNGLEEKKASIAQAEKNLKNARKNLEIFQGELDDKLDRLSKLKKQIETDLADIDKKKTLKEQQQQAAFEAKMDRLVKMYSGMKPKNAAKIVDKLDLEVAKRIFSRMRETSAAQILAYVNSEKAAKISELIAYKRQ